MIGITPSSSSPGLTVFLRKRTPSHQSKQTRSHNANAVSWIHRVTAWPTRRRLQFTCGFFFPYERKRVSTHTMNLLGGLLHSCHVRKSRVRGSEQQRRRMKMCGVVVSWCRGVCRGVPCAVCRVPKVVLNVGLLDTIPYIQAMTSDEFVSVSQPTSLSSL